MKLIEEGFLKRNRKILIVCILIMLVSAIVGAGIGYIKAGDNLNAISKALESTNVTGNESSDLSSTDLFAHNLTTDILIILGGILFSVISVIAVVFNGLSIGVVFGVDLKYACASILPHAIPEYLAGAIALSAAFIVTKIMIDAVKTRSFKNHETEFKDILTLIIIMIVLLAVAAVIEGHIPPMIIQWTYGLN